MRFLTDVAEVARGKFSHRPRNDPAFYDGATPFVQIGDISAAGRYIRNYSQTLNARGLSVSRLFPVGTVLIAITGATIGVTGILTFESCFPDSIVGITARHDVMTSEFLFYALEHAKQAALDEATQTTQPNINLKNLVKLKVPAPPLSVQEGVVRYLDELQQKCDSHLDSQRASATALGAMMPSILDWAFKGDL